MRGAHNLLLIIKAPTGSLDKHSGSRTSANPSPKSAAAQVELHQEQAAGVGLAPYPLRRTTVLLNPKFPKSSIPKSSALTPLEP